MKKIRKAIIPAAGLGTRFLPATKAQPKEMLPIVDKPTIQYIVEEVVASGIEDILIITGRGKRAIEDHFDRSFELETVLAQRGKEDLLGVVQAVSDLVDIHYIRQKEARGLGHAIYCARKFIGNEPFAVLLGDDIVSSRVPCLKQLIDVYEQTGASVLGVQAVAEDEVSRYGIVKPGKAALPANTVEVLDLVEKPAKQDAPSNMAVMGRYIITPEIFAILENTPPGAGGEIQLTDGLKELLKHQSIYAYQFEGKRYDAGTVLGYLQTTVEFALNHPDLREQFARYLVDLVEQLNLKEVISEVSVGKE